MRLLELSVACVLLLPLAAVDAQGHPRGTPVALTSIGLVDDLDAGIDPDDPGTGGGFDAETYFQNLLVSKVHQCGKGVLQVFLNWAKEGGINIDKTSFGDAATSGYTTISEPPGVLELSYRFDTEKRRSRVTLFFYARDGTKMEPTTIEGLLRRFKVAGLQDKLRDAVTCS